MSKQILITGIVAVIAIVAIVLIVDATLTGFVIGASDFYTRPSGMQMRLESGVVVLQSDVAVNSVCKNAIFCESQATYTCCRHDGTSCILPTAGEHLLGSCPKTHRSRCQCREDYVAGLVEEYG
jgi:hypothetical protein